MQIRSRLTVQFILISASILFLSFLTIYYLAEKHREHEFYGLLKNKAITTSDLLIKVQEVDSSLLKLIDKSKKDLLLNENISIYNYLNKEIYTNNDSIDFSYLIEDINETINQVRLYGEKRFSAGQMDIIGIPYIDRFNRFVVIAGAIDAYGRESQENLKGILVAVFIIMLIAVGVAGWIYSGRALRPISSVINQVDRISENNMSLRLAKEDSEDEISRLSHTFNKMLDRLETAFKVQKTFVANASHELRNPLTKITSQLEVSLLKDRDNEEYKKIISSVLEDIKNLNEISHRLLQLAKISSAESDLKFSQVRIDELIWETKAEYLLQHPDCCVNFYLDELPDDEVKLTIRGNPQFLKICFQNLIDNACKFSSDRTVNVKLSPGKEQITVNISDKGKGIDKADLPYIFEPFYRSRSSSNTTGYGIGLSLAEKIAVIHKARITVSSEIDQGTCFTMVFPIS